MAEETDPLTQEQIDAYLRDGILVVPNLLSTREVIDAHVGLARTLKEEYGVDVHDLERTGRGLVEASSTNGAGEFVRFMVCRYDVWTCLGLPSHTLHVSFCKHRRSTRYLLSRVEDEDSN